MADNRVDRINGLVGSIAVKAPCKVATTAAITLSGAQTIDGIALTADETPRQRVLVKDQADDTENGIYDVNSGAWTRSPDFDGSRDVVDGTQVLVNEGTPSFAKSYYLSATNPVVIGTDSLTFIASSNTEETFSVSDEAYNATTWNGETTTAPSKNAVRDKIVSIDSGKQDVITGAATTIVASDLTASRAMASNASGKVAVATATLAQLNFLADVTSLIQAQIDSKLAANSDFVIKGWVNFNGSTMNINDSINVDSLDDNGTGDFDVNWTTNFAHQYYPVVVTSAHVGASATFGTANTYAVGSVNILVQEYNNTDIDSTIINVIAIGDQ